MSADQNVCVGLAGGGAFTGQSRTLAGGPAAPPAATPSAPSAPSSQPIVHTITFYSDGVFTVDDGEDTLLPCSKLSAVVS